MYRPCAHPLLNHGFWWMCNACDVIRRSSLCVPSSGAASLGADSGGSWVAADVSNTSLCGLRPTRMLLLGHYWARKESLLFPLWECLGEGGGSLTDRTDGYGMIVRWYEIIRTVVNVSGIYYYISQSTYQKHMSIMFWRTTKFDIGILTLKYLLLVCLCLSKKVYTGIPQIHGVRVIIYWMAMSPCRPMSV